MADLNIFLVYCNIKLTLNSHATVKNDIQYQEKA